jgi:predicted RNA-binding protein YlxR (DUF448 family)
MSTPLRTCIGCGGVAPCQGLVRVRVEDGGRVVVDATRSGGRGAWLHRDEACLGQALRRRAFARAFKRGDLGLDGEALRRDVTAVVSQVAGMRSR